jgi:hypothetical protein
LIKKPLNENTFLFQQKSFRLECNV